MKLPATLTNYYQEIPEQVRFFLSRALVLFIVWKLIYHLILFPVRIPDRQLTLLTASSASYLYALILNEPLVYYKETLNAETRNAVLYVNGERAIGIGDGCNGLELYVLYICFLWCIPTSAKKQLLYIVVGSAVIFVSNGFRCFGLAWLYLHNYSWANFAHHYLFKMIIYAMIFYAWVLYSKKWLKHAH